MDEFRIEDLLDENLIFMNEEAPDYETLLHNLSDKLEEKGYVKRDMLMLSLEENRYIRPDFLLIL